MSDLEDAMVQARALLVEVRQSIKDMKAVKREIDDALKAGVNARVEAMVEDRVCRALAELGTVTQWEMAKSVAKVIREFDRLENIMLGKEKSDPRPSIEDLIRRRESDE